MFCGNCGKKLSDEHKFCPMCGEMVKVDLMNLPKSEEPSRNTSVTVDTPKINGTFIFVLAASVVMVLIMITTDIFKFECNYKDGGESDTDSFTLSVFGEKDDMGRHENSDEFKVVIPEIKSTLGITFALVTASLIAACLLSYLNKNGLSLIMMFFCFSTLIIVGTVLDDFWKKAIKHETNYYGFKTSLCSHSTESTVGYNIILTAVIAVIVALITIILKNAVKDDSENANCIDSNLSNVN